MKGQYMSWPDNHTWGPYTHMDVHEMDNPADLYDIAIECKDEPADPRCPACAAYLKAGQLERAEAGMLDLMEPPC